MKIFFIFLIFSSIKSTISSETSKFDELALKIKPNVDEKTQQKAAMGVIRRLLPERADNVAIKVNFKLPLNYFKVRTYLRMEIQRNDLKNLKFDVKLKNLKKFS